MKRFISLMLALMMLVSAFAVFPLTASAAENTLTVTCRGQVLGEVEVGSEFIFRVKMSSAGYRIYSGQAEVRYDSEHVQLVEHGTVSGGSVNMNAYSFPARVRNASLYTSYFDTKNRVNYNFYRMTGIAAFDISEEYLKLRFKAIAPGTTELRHYAEIFTTYVDNKDVRLFYFDKGNDKLDDIPYMVPSIEPALGLIGDADGDGTVGVTDATYIQYLTAGAQNPYKALNTDANSDGSIDLRDALAILRYKAKMPTDTPIGEWVYASEQGTADGQ